MTSPMDAYADLIGRTFRVDNADTDFLNLVDVETGERFHVDCAGRRMLVFESPPDGQTTHEAHSSTADHD